MRLRPMSLFELGRSDGRMSLSRLMDGGPAPSVASAQTLDEVAELLCVGGWPGHLRRASRDAAMLANEDYVGEICSTDIGRAGGAGRDPERVRRFMQSLARNTATVVSVAAIARDAQGSDAAFSEQTARSYLTALERLMVVEQQPAWAPHLRSRSRLRTSRKRHFVDPSLATAAVGAGPEHLLKDIPWFGFLFESMAVRDLRVHAQALRATVHHYRDNTGLEVDAIVDAGVGRWAAFEIKLGAGRVEEAARTLLAFAERVDTERCGMPAALGVITATGHGYQRPDGVAVIPLGALGP